MITHDCKIRVWYKHTDQMAICHHSNYICYYEAARSELLRSLGMSFAEVEKRGIMMPILEVNSKYHKPAYFDELLTVRISLRDLPMARITFYYEIFNEAGELLNTGSTMLGFIHSDTRRPCRCPEWFMALLTKTTEETL
ncbi:MAG: thioesterase family protein [Alistipes sp.]